VPEDASSRPGTGPASGGKARAARGFFAPPVPRLIAHRGASGTTPENTLAAFRAAVEAGAEMIELDLHLSADGVPVVIHDGKLDRTTDGRGPAARRSAAELAAIDAGHRFSADGGRTFPYRDAGLGVPPLREVLDALPHVRFTLEVKTADSAVDRALAADLSACDAGDRVLLASMDGEVVRRLRRSFPGVPTNLARDEVVAFLRTGRVPAAASALQVPERQGLRRIVTAESVGAAHAAGLEVHVWTVNAPPSMRRLLDLGVDGIMSDFPERLREVYRERGLR
jgi:glycerophosphoryl diester phosphodiesterase